MAKKSTNTATESVASSVYETKLVYKDFTIRVDELSPTGVAYLLQYGFAKSLQDSVAGLAKKLRADDPAISDKEVDSEILRVQGDRVAAILHDDVGTRSAGPRRKGIDKVMAEVAIERLKAAFSKAGKQWPTGKGSAEGINALVVKYIDKFEVSVRDEAERRMELSVDDGLSLEELGL